MPASPAVNTIVVDPLNPRRVYALGPAGLFRSTDAGQSWVPADKGLPGQPLAVALDPVSPHRILAVLADDSVWASTDGISIWQRLGTPQALD